MKQQWSPEIRMEVFDMTGTGLTHYKLAFVSAGFRYARIVSDSTVRVRRFLFVALFLAGVLAGSAGAQTTSTIEGAVKDANGAVIAGATIKVSGSALSTERSVTSDAI
jgi:hypothetical protein